MRASIHLGWLDEWALLRTVDGYYHAARVGHHNWREVVHVFTEVTLARARELKLERSIPSEVCQQWAEECAHEANARAMQKV